MGKQKGTAGQAVKPVEPEVAEEADVADPGIQEKIKAEQVKQQKGKYGSKPVKSHKPAKTEEEKKKKKSWIEIELVGEDDKPIPGKRYRITLPDGSEAKGTLDQNGFARVEGFEKGSGKCKVCFLGIDKNRWGPV